MSKKKSLLLDLICGILILLFIYAAASKLLDYEKFKVQLGQSPMLTSIAGIVSWTIPTVEIILSLMLMMPTLRLLALYGSFSLMTVFATYIFLLLHFSEHIPCSCGGILEAMTWSTHFYFNLGFVLLIVYAIILQTMQKNKFQNSSVSNIYCNKSGQAQNL